VAQRRPWKAEGGLRELIEPLSAQVERRHLLRGVDSWMTARHCAGSCLYCTPASSGEFLPKNPATGLAPGGVWQRLHEALPKRAQTGPIQVDRARTGSKHHVITGGKRVPIGGDADWRQPQRHLQALPLIDAIPPVRPRRAAPAAAGQALCRPGL
jgi:hypothetical protein